MKKISKNMGTITAVCAAFSGFMFGCLSLFYLINRGDVMLAPFAIIGFIGAAVMWANRK